jgi:hypothetical protein
METCDQHFISHGALQRMLGGIDISYGNKHTRAAIARNTYKHTAHTLHTDIQAHSTQSKVSDAGGRSYRLETALLSGRITETRGSRSFTAHSRIISVKARMAAATWR